MIHYMQLVPLPGSSGLEFGDYFFQPFCTLLTGISLNSSISVNLI